MSGVEIVYAHPWFDEPSVYSFSVSRWGVGGCWANYGAAYSEPVGHVNRIPVVTK